ncbi:MAG: hypothetical protein A2W10_07660 [Deltaproteobacteria bacterium RBG_16_55_12]|nr:MAG: hypothetical protein A2W10_07660 [Deltaproteobacteria bacterium RBG_16_55_12]
MGPGQGGRALDRRQALGLRIGFPFLRQISLKFLNFWNIRKESRDFSAESLLFAAANEWNVFCVDLG